MSSVVLQHPKATHGVGHSRAEGAGTHYGHRFSIAKFLRTLLVAVLGMASVGCAAEVDVPATATRLVPEGRVVCSNLQLDIPKGWTLEPTGPNQWRMVAPQSSSYEGWVGLHRWQHRFVPAQEDAGGQCRPTWLATKALRP